MTVAVAGDRLRIAVSDSGIGIAPDRLEDVFESFQQADNSTTRRFGGTGLGLTICRNLARAMGGDITIVSTAGQGSTFTLDLPLVLAAGEAIEIGRAGKRRASADPRTQSDRPRDDADAVRPQGREDRFRRRRRGIDGDA